MAVVRDPVSADFKTDSTAKNVPATAALKPVGGEGLELKIELELKLELELELELGLGLELEMELEVDVEVELELELELVLELELALEWDGRSQDRVCIYLVGLGRMDFAGSVLAKMKNVWAGIEKKKLTSIQDLMGTMFYVHTLKHNIYETDLDILLQNRNLISPNTLPSKTRKKLSSKFMNFMKLKYLMQTIRVVD